MIVNDTVTLEEKPNPDTVLQDKPISANPTLDKFKAKLIAGKSKKLTIRKDRIFILALIAFLLGRLSVNYLH